MAGMFEKLQEGISGTFEKAKNMAGNLATGTSDELSLSGAKNQKKSLLQEKQKYLCYLGMATYNLHREGKLENEELASDFEQLREIDGKLDELENIIEKQESMKRPKNICECGAKITKKDQFCPNCGKKVKDTILCTCGKELSQDMKFCNYCGMDIAKLLQNEEVIEEEKVCICGTKILTGQIMCMECGRMVE